VGKLGGSLGGSNPGLTLSPHCLQIDWNVGFPASVMVANGSGHGLVLTAHVTSLLGFSHSSPKSIAEFSVVLESATQCSEIGFLGSLVCKFIYSYVYQRKSSDRLQGSTVEQGLQIIHWGFQAHRGSPCAGPFPSLLAALWTPLA